MNTLELTCMLESDPAISKFNPKVLAKGQFFEVNVQRRYGIFIVNDQEQWKIGNHWSLVVILPQEITFFDSFTRPPKHYAMDKYLHKMERQVVVNEMVLQRSLSNVCGEFCMLFGYFLCRGWRCRSFSLTIVEHCNFIYCALTCILTYQRKYIKTKQ